MRQHFPMFARLVFAFVDFAVRKGLAEPGSDQSADAGSATSARHRAWRTGIRGETYAYWYLRRHGYIMPARNYTLPGIKGEVDIIGCEGPFHGSENAGRNPDLPAPEYAVNPEKRRHFIRMARQFLRSRRVESNFWRFDVVAIGTHPAKRPTVRLPEGALDSA